MSERLDLKVPKKAVRVRLALIGHPARETELFVADHEAVAALLEGANEFLPAHDVENDDWLAFHLQNVVSVAVPTGEGAPHEDELFDNQHAVRVELTTGTVLEGWLLYSNPPDHARVIDYLNLPGRFFELWRPAELCLVNKRYVSSVSEAREK